MPLIAVLELHLKADQVVAAREFMSGVLAQTRDFEGCEGVDVIEDLKDEAHWLIIEKWRDSEADAAYRAWRAGDGKIVGLADMVVSAPGMTKYESTDV